MVKTKHPFQRLLAQYQTGHRQQHPCTCGPSSMALVASALGLGSFSEDAWLSRALLNVAPVTEFTYRGIALHELQIVSEIVFANRVEIIARRAYPENFECFLTDLKATSHSRNQLMVINYLQGHVLEPGVGEPDWPHHSPVAGFNAKTNEVLIADVDVEVEKEYWASAARVFESMVYHNAVYNLPRGWLIIKKREA